VTLTVALAALAKRPDGKLPMIPSGTLTARKLLETDATKGGETRKVQLIALTGVGFTPQTVWATTGREPAMFAFIYPGAFHLIEEGWESNIPALEAAQIKAEKEMLVDLNKRVSHALPGKTLIQNARVFDSETATLGDARDVLIENGRIISVVPPGTEKRAADRKVDAAGRVMLPGLFDMHVHLGFWDGGLHVATGITSVRDMGNDNETLLKLMDQEKAGTLLMPRVIPAGFIEGESPNASRSGFVIKDLDGAKKAIDWYHVSDARRCLTELVRAGKDEVAMPVQVITLEVTPAEAEKLAFAATRGKFRLALRSPLTKEEALTPGATIDSLLSSYQGGETGKKRGNTMNVGVQLIRGKEVTVVPF